MSLSGLVRKNALKCGLQGQRRTSFRRIEIRQVRKASNEPQTESEAPELAEIQLYSDMGFLVENMFPRYNPLTTRPIDDQGRHYFSNDVRDSSDTLT